MCFWFGLKILRLVYRKAFLEILNGSILFDILSSEKSSAASYKSWEKISPKLGVQGIKRSGILGWFQKCPEVSTLVKKTFLQKNWFLGIWKIFAKNCFYWEKIFGNFLTQEIYTFLKSAQSSASFDNICAQFFLEVKRLKNVFL